MTCSDADIRRWERFQEPPPCGPQIELEASDDELEHDDQEVDAADQADPVEDKDATGSERQVDILVSLALEMYEFHQTPDGDPIVVPKDGPPIVRALRGHGATRSVRAELAAAYAARRKKAPSSQPLTDALLVLEGLCYGGGELHVHLRVADDAGVTVLDLGGPEGSAVVIEDGVWSVQPTPVAFRRTPLTRPLPQPETPGDLDSLRSFLNIDDESWPLLCAWLVSCLLPGIPAPIVLLAGEQGSAKTTFARYMVSLVDPSYAETRAGPRDQEGWIVSAAGSWLVALDNISKVQEWLSNALCRAVTGEGLVRRALYTNDDVTVISFRRRIILTSIDPGSLVGDLSDRLLRIELERISEGSRREEAEIEEAFRAAHPKIFAGLLDLTAKVKQIAPTIELHKRPRMADFARIVAAVDEVLGTQGLKTYLEQARSIVGDVLDGDPVGVRLRSFLDGRPTPWEGTAGELLEELNGRLNGDRPPKGWPTSPRGMAANLKKLAPSLRAAGFAADYLGQKGHHRQRTWRLGKPEEEGMEPSAPSAPSADPGDQGSHLFGDADGCADGQAADDTIRPQPSAEPSAPNLQVGPQVGPHADGEDGSAAAASACCEGGNLEPRCQLCSSSPTYHRAP